MMLQVSEGTVSTYLFALTCPCIFNEVFMDRNERVSSNTSSEI